MNRAISWLQRIRLRQVLTAFLVALTFIIGTAFDHYGNELQAQAEPVTPEATNYKIDRTDSRIRVNTGNPQDAVRSLAKDTKQATKNVKKSTQDKGKDLFQNIREKLNLDEPIDSGTKQTFEQIQDEASEAVNAPKDSLKDAADKVGTFRNQ